MKTISVLGSTGSIGTQTLEVVRNNQDIKVAALAAGSNAEKLAEQIREFSPRIACIYDETKVAELRLLTGDLDVQIVSGMDGLCAAGDSRGKQRRHIQIALGDGRRPDADALIRQADVQCVPVCLGKDGHRRDAHFLAGADDAHGDLPAVCNEYF